MSTTDVRTDTLAQLKANPEVGVLVVGAGINGIGTFRDLAHQGVDVLLVDKGDFGSGASAASSHMLHGGIRYLENGEFRLVREALTERNLMLRNAPHYAKPLPTTIPMFRWLSGFLNAPLKFVGLRSKPSERGAAVIKIGLIFYDIFARAYKVMPNHTFMLRQRALQEYPKMNPQIVSAARYYDSFMPYPERICLELVQDGVAANENARALNYVSAAGAEGDSVTLRDELTGESFSVKPKLVINAAGPWIDFANRAMNRDTRFIGGTKGSHLIIDNPELFEAIGSTEDYNEIFFENNDGRIVLILQYVDGTVMIGTTDIRIEDPEEAVTTEDEIEYILGMLPRVFPTITVDRSQVVFAFSGVRPLPYSDASFTGNVSRDHSIKVVEPDDALSFPVYSLVGGKWTSFRALSEQTTDKSLAFLGQERRVGTQNMAIGGGAGYPTSKDAQAKWIAELAARHSLEVDRARILFERYGTYAEAVAAFMAAGDDAALANNARFTRREVAFLAGEQVERLDDVVLRRSLMAWLGGFTDALLLEVADIVAEAKGWSAERKAEEIERTVKILNEKHMMQLSVPVA